MQIRSQPSFTALLFVGLLIASPAAAQDQIDFHPESTITVDGTSNKSDWTVTATEFIGVYTLADDAPDSVELTIPVMQMKGGKSLIMDRLMRDAMNAPEHPEIRFVSTAIEPAEDAGWNVIGDLTISGETLSVVVPVTKTDLGAFTGSLDIKMSDWGVKPPTAMFGSLRTADEITVNFNVMPAEDAGTN